MKSSHKLRARNPHSLVPYYASAKESTGKTGGGRLGRGSGKGREEGGVVVGNIVEGRPVERTLM